MKSKKKILELIASTRSDDFVDAGRAQGAQTYEAIRLLMAQNDEYLTLKALQIAFSLGVKSASMRADKWKNQADSAIEDAINRVSESGS